VKIPDSILQIHSLKRVPLYIPGTKAQAAGTFEFEYPRLRDVLYKPTDLFSGRELHSIEWIVTKEGGIRVPKLNFLGDDSKGLISTPDWFKLQNKTLSQGLKSYKAIIPENGLSQIRIRSTAKYIREITLAASDGKIVANLLSTCEAGESV